VFCVWFGVRGSRFGVRGSAQRCNFCGVAASAAWQKTKRRTRTLSKYSALLAAQLLPLARSMGHGVRRFMNLRAWQACDAYKKAVYGLCDEPPLSRDWKLRRQLQDSVAGPPAHIAEGFGRFNPPDFARFTVVARASLMESQNHLQDAVDRKHITEERRAELDAPRESGARGSDCLMEYLQSPEALRNARRARERRMATRQQRRSRRSEATARRNYVQTPQSNGPSASPERRTRHERGAQRERATQRERRARHERRTRRTRNTNLNTNRAPRTRKTER
jgi:four helix bundle protein